MTKSTKQNILFLVFMYAIIATIDKIVRGNCKFVKKKQQDETVHDIDNSIVLMRLLYRLSI